MEKTLVPLSEGELYAIIALVHTWRNKNKLKKNASPEAKEFDENLQSGFEKLCFALEKHKVLINKEEQQ